jgi:hypothetical protein
MGLMLLASCAGEHFPFFGSSEGQKSDVASHPLGSIAASVTRTAHPAATVKRDPSYMLYERLIGLNENQLQSVLGPPAAQSDHSPGKDWQYRDGRCSFILVLYPDVDTRVYHALSYEVISDDSSAGGKRHCLEQIEAWVHNS